jgi:hypothetical protein
MNYYKPIKSDKPGKKFKVKLYIPSTGKDKIIYFGASDYEDFTQHKDSNRKKNYLTRSAGIKNKSGKLTKNDYTSPNFWSRRYLWDSKESYGKLPLPSKTSPKKSPKKTSVKKSPNKTSVKKSPKKTSVKKSPKKTSVKKNRY